MRQDRVAPGLDLVRSSCRPSWYTMRYLKVERWGMADTGGFMRRVNQDAGT
jgi:hypothetical protein